MAPKSKTHDNVAQEALPVPAAPSANPAFKRIGAVMIPTLKVLENVPVFVHITQAIQTKQAQVKGEDGVMRLKDIAVMNVVNLETGELMQMVPGKALEQNLKDYKGGNNAYVGLSFEITKHAAAEGKRWKPYSLFEVEAGQ